MEQSNRDIRYKRIFQAFHQNHVRLFYHFAARYVDDTEVVRDIVQDAFISVWQRMEEFENEEHIKAFIYKTIRNRSMNYLRDKQVEQKHREKLSLLQHEEEFQEHILEEEAYDYLCRKIEQLPEMQKKVIWLHVDGLSNEEIARELNITVNTVLTHKQRARAILKKYLNDSSDILFLALIFSI